jgi:transcriptional regulator with XRE-family HTH domain
VARGFEEPGSATIKERPPPSVVAGARRRASTGINGNGSSSQGDEIFGRLVAVRRAALGLSQEDLAGRMETSQASVAGIESGRAPSLEALELLGVALAAEPRTGSGWRSVGGRWRWGGLAIAILVAALLILNDGRSGENDGGASSGRLPEAAYPAQAAPAPVLRVGPQGKSLTLRETVNESKPQKTKGATPSDVGGAAPGEGHPHSAPGATLAPTSPAKPTPSPPSAVVSPPPSDSSSTPAPLRPTGTPEGSPGNGPGGGGGSNGGGVPGGGNGPGGGGPPGQMP